MVYPKKQAGIYARISVDEKKRGGVSISSQIRACKEFVSKMGWQLTGEYTDQGWSGETLIRPELDKLRDDIKSGKVNTVIAYHPDRLSRHQSNQFLLLGEFEKYGADLIFTSVPEYSNGSEESKVIFKSVYSMAAELERLRIRERMRRGKREKSLQGIILPGKEPPYGYNLLRKKENNGVSDYAINPEEAKSVKSIFEWVQDGMSARGVIKKLAELKVLRRQQKEGKPSYIWARSTIHKILKNELYCGVFHWNKYQAVEAKKPLKETRYRRVLRSSRRLRPREEWIGIERPKLAIISRTLYDVVQKQLLRNTVLRQKSSKNFYLLAGMLKHGPCGSPLYSETYHGQRYYRCANRNQRYPLPPTCKGSKKADILEKAFVDAVIKALNDPDKFVASLTKRGFEELEAARAGSFGLEELRNKLADLDKQEGRLVELWRSGVIQNLEAIAKQVREIQKNRKDLNEKIKTFLFDRRTIESEELFEGSVKELFANLRAAIESMDRYKLREIFQLLSLQGTWSDDKVEIQGYLPIPDTPTKDQPSDFKNSSLTSL